MAIFAMAIAGNCIRLVTGLTGDRRTTRSLYYISHVIDVVTEHLKISLLNLTKGPPADLQSVAEQK